MSIYVKLAIVAVGILLIVSVVRSIVKRGIAEEQGLLWMIPAVVIIIGGAFPSLIIDLARALGVGYAPSLVFTFALMILFYLIFRCTKWIGKVTARQQELSIQVSLLVQENEELKRRLDVTVGQESSRPL